MQGCLPTSPSGSPTRLLAQGPIQRAWEAAGGRMSPQLWVGPGATRLSVPVPSPQGLHALPGRGHPAVPLSLQVPPGPALVWASRGRAAKSGKLHPSQKPILSPHTHMEGGRARIGASGLAGVRASISPSGKGWRRWQCPRVGGARGSPAPACPWHTSPGLLLHHLGWKYPPPLSPPPRELFI